MYVKFLTMVVWSPYSLQFLQNLPVTRIVDNLMELKPSPETDEYRYFDPKLLKPGEGVNPAPIKSRAQFQDAIVFMVGGGTYAEYQNLVDYAKVLVCFFPFSIELFNFNHFFPLKSKTVGGNAKKIVYGCSTLNNGNQFLKQVNCKIREKQNES